MLLTGKPIVGQLTLETRQRLEDNNKQDGYVAIFLCSDDKSSEVYVGLKAEYAQELGIYADIKLGKDRSTIEIIEEIQQCNIDENCLGILVQLPLDKQLQQEQGLILDSIDPAKDIDGLTSQVFGQAAFGYTQMMGATPRSAFEILDHYDLGDLTGKTALIVTQSNLIGKRITMECMHRGATIISANHHTDPKMLAESFGIADVVFSATGAKHLIGEDLLKDASLSSRKSPPAPLSEGGSNLSPTPPAPSPLLEGEGLGESLDLEVPLADKVLIDIGRGSDEDGAYGDVDREFFQDKVKAVTPVPGGVGPVTVASLFANLTKFEEHRDELD